MSRHFSCDQVLCAVAPCDEEGVLPKNAWVERVFVDICSRLLSAGITDTPEVLRMRGAEIGGQIVREDVALRWYQTVDEAVDAKVTVDLISTKDGSRFVRIEHVMDAKSKMRWTLRIELALPDQFQSLVSQCDHDGMASTSHYQSGLDWVRTLGQIFLEITS